MKIKHLEFKHGLFLAPMAGITDHAFRALCVANGAEGVTTELVSAKAVVYGDKKTDALARVYPDERIAAIQLFGSEPEIMASAARSLMRFKPDYIDINMGCPVPKLVKNGEGSALLRNPDLCEKIVYTVCEAVSVPVTVKIRRACDDDAPESGLAAAVACERGGASAVFVHGRSRSEMYHGRADRKIIKKIKDSLSVPVIGNGDVACYDDFVAMKSETDCDGVMIGRGAYGSPWVFAEIRARLEGREFTPPTDSEKRDMLVRQLKTVIAEKGNRGVCEFRHHLLQYCRYFSGSARLRKEISLITDEKTAIDAIDTIFY